MRLAPLPLVLAASLAAAPAIACESPSRVLFVCATDEADKGYIEFCSDGDVLADPVSAAQLVIHHADGSIMSVPADGPAAATDFAFAHSNGEEGYLVTARLREGSDSYYLYSLAIPPSGEAGDMGGAEAGIARRLPDGSVEPLATCAERPEIFISAMQAHFACDGSSPLGPAACSETGAERVAPLPASPAAPIPVAP